MRHDCRPLRLLFMWGTAMKMTWICGGWRSLRSCKFSASCCYFGICFSLFSSVERARHGLYKHGSSRAWFLRCDFQRDEQGDGRSGRFDPPCVFCRPSSFPVLFCNSLWTEYTHIKTVFRNRRAWIIGTRNGVQGAGSGFRGADESEI